jgi:hypothetical protein
VLDKTPLTPATKDLVKKILADAKKPVDTTTTTTKTPKEVVDEVVNTIKKSVPTTTDGSNTTTVITKIIKTVTEEIKKA